MVEQALAWAARTAHTLRALTRAPTAAARAPVRAAAPGAPAARARAEARAVTAVAHAPSSIPTAAPTIPGRMGLAQAAPTAATIRSTSTASIFRTSRRTRR